MDAGASPEPNARILIGPSIATRKIVGLVLAIGGFVIGGIALLIVLAWGTSLLLYKATKDG